VPEAVPVTSSRTGGADTESDAAKKIRVAAPTPVMLVLRGRPRTVFPEPPPLTETVVAVRVELAVTV
jgi:hypothetical protein